MTSSRRTKTKYPGVYYRIGRDDKRQYEITYRDEHGKQRWERVQGDQEAAVNALADIKLKLRGGQPVKPLEKTFQQVHDEWAEIALPRLRKSTATTYKRSLKNYVLPEFGTLKVQQVDERRIAKWIAELQSNGRKAWTIRAAITPLRRILTYAVRERLISENPVGRLGRDELPKSDQRERRILAADELPRLFAQCSARYRLPVQMLAFTGLRVSELIGLIWQDLDLGPGTLQVRFQLDEAGNRVPPKTEESRRKVFLMPALTKALKAHKLASGYSASADFVFADDSGEPMGYPGLVSGFKYACKKAELGEPKPTMHGLRHGFGSMLIANGSDAVFVSRQLGHANPAITMRIYAHEFGQGEQAAKMTEAMESQFGEAMA